MNNIKIKLKTSELTGAALDWAVAKCEVGDAINEIDDPHFYSTDWALAGPIIEREKIEPGTRWFLSGGLGFGLMTGLRRPNTLDSGDALLCGKQTG
jgi:hypothetical protein